MLEDSKEIIAGRLAGDRRNVRKTANSAPTIRLWNLDAYDNDLQELLKTYKEYKAGIDDLERTYASMAREGSFILRSIRYRQKIVKEEVKGVVEEASRIRALVYDLKRRTPGRKAEKKLTRLYFQQLKQKAYERMRRIPGPDLQHPNVPVHPAVAQWHQIILPNDGACNLSTEVCLGVTRDETIVDRRVRKSVQHQGEVYGSAHKWWHFMNGDMFPLEYVTQTLVSQTDDARFALQNTSRPSFERNRETFHLYLEYVYDST